jgi:hypothetical protein
MRNPQIGDLVLEVSSWNQTWDPDSIEHLIGMEGVDRHPSGTLVDRYMVAPLHDQECHQGWRNASFIALPQLEPGLDGDLVGRYANARAKVAELLPHPERSAL